MQKQTNWQEQHVIIVIIDVKLIKVIFLKILKNKPKNKVIDNNNNNLKNNHFKKDKKIRNDQNKPATKF